MYKKILFSTLITLLLVGTYSNQANALCPIIDTQNMSKVFKNIFNVHVNQATASETASKEEELQEIQSGKAGCSANPGMKKTEIQTTAWDYIASGTIKKTVTQKDDEGKEKKTTSETKIIDIISNSQFLNMPSSGTNITEAKEELIKSMFFESKEAYENGSSSEKEALQTKRKKYANEVASKGYALATALRPRVQKDAQSLLAAQTSSCNQLQSHALQNRNLKALIKTTAANIIVQILSMENEAAVQLLNEPLVEISEEQLKKDLKKGEKK